MVEQNRKHSKEAKQKSILDLLLDDLQWDYMDFADHLEINYRTLYQYRKGQRELRLTWQQIKKLELLLAKQEKRFNDLPDDWFRDKE